MKKIENLVNFYAKNSVPAFQKNRAIREFSRLCYQTLSAFYCAVSFDYIKRQTLQEKGDTVDTYPWPYREAWFADWEENSTPAKYSLIDDPAGFVIKCPASYCAWKIFEFNGSWLVRYSCFNGSDEYWYHLLFCNGYWQKAKRPQSGKKYTGLAKSRNLRGEVVWFEGFDDGASVNRENDTGERIVYSAYRNKKYMVGVTPAERYDWIEITKSHTIL